MLNEYCKYLPQKMLEIYGNTTLGVLFKIHAISYSSVKTIISIPQSNAATAAKSLQSRPTLCDPRDGSQPGSPVPGILQARTLEWVAIFSSMRESESEVAQLCLTLHNPMDAAHQAPPSLGFSRQVYWSGVPLPSLSIS